MANQRVSPGLYRNQQGALTRNAGMAPPMNGGNPGRPMPQVPNRGPDTPPVQGSGMPTRGNVNDTPSPGGMYQPWGKTPGNWPQDQMMPLPGQYNPQQPQTGGGDPMMGGGTGYISEEQSAKIRNSPEYQAQEQSRNSMIEQMKKQFGAQFPPLQQNAPIDPGMGHYTDPGMNGPPPNFGGFGGFNKGSGFGDGGQMAQIMGQYGANAIGGAMGQQGQAPMGPGGLQPGVPPGQGPGRPSQGGFQRVGAGQYRGAKGKIVNSAQNPGNVRGLLSKPPMR